MITLSLRVQLGKTDCAHGFFVLGFFRVRYCMFEVIPPDADGRGILLP